VPIIFHSSNLPLSTQDAQRLWEKACEYRAKETGRPSREEETIGIKSVSAAEIQALNKQYRRKNAPTNVLVFSYPPEHDIALCLEVAAPEAAERQQELKSYAALLLTHAFLHVLGVDHERSAQEAEAQAQAEQSILAACGFAQNPLY
jgi:rRNA maturation RNase YbeY